jgi:hypothetical protein
MGSIDDYYCPGCDKHFICTCPKEYEYENIMCDLITLIKDKAPELMSSIDNNVLHWYNRRLGPNHAVATCHSCQRKI